MENKKCMGLTRVIMRATAAPPSAQSASLFYEVIRVVSMVMGLGRLSRLSLVAINQSVCGGRYPFSIPHITFLSLLLACSWLFFLVRVMDLRKHLQEESLEVDGPPSCLLSSLRD